MGTIECSQPASKSSWDSQDFDDISMVLKMAHFRKSTGPRWVNTQSSASFVVIALAILNEIIWSIKVIRINLLYDNQIISYKTCVSFYYQLVLGHWQAQW